MSSLIEITLISQFTLFLHTPVITSYPQSLHFILRNHTFEPFTFFPSLSLHGYLILSLTSSWKSAIQQICFSLNGDKHIYKLPLKIIDKAFEAAWPPTPPAFKEAPSPPRLTDWLTDLTQSTSHILFFTGSDLLSGVRGALKRHVSSQSEGFFFWQYLWNHHSSSHLSSVFQSARVSERRIRDVTKRQLIFILPAGDLDSEHGDANRFII